MSDIVLSSSVRSNLLNLQQTSELIATTQNRLATGRKVNSALDNPTNFFTASSLNSRANDLSNLLDGLSNGIKTIEAADNGLKAITRTVETLQSTVRQARQDKSFKTETYSLSSTATGNLSFTGGAVGSTAVDIALTTTGGGTAVAASAGSQTAAAFSSFTLEAGTAATAGTSSFAFSTANFQSADDQITFDIAVDGGGTTSVTIDQTIANANSVGNDGNLDTIAEFEAAFSAALTAAGASGFTVGNDGTNITLTSSSTGASSAVNITTVASAGTTDPGTSGLGSLTEVAGQAAGSADTFSFDIAVDGGSATTVSISQADIAAIGNNDSTVDDLAEFQALVSAALTGAGVTGVTVGNDASGLTFTSSTTGASSAVAITNAAVANNNTTTALAVGSTGLDSLTTVAGADASVSGATTAVKTVEALVTEINANASLKDKVRASSVNGQLRVENISTSDLTLTGVGTGGSIDGGTGTGDIGGNSTRNNLVSQFNELRSQLDRLADDSGFNGINLLRGDRLRLSFNETGTSSIDIQAKDADGNVRAITSEELGIGAATAAGFESDDSLDAILEDLGGALGELRTQSSAFGANLSSVQNRQEFTKSTINTLRTGADNLTLADINEEAANLLSLQTRQQLSNTALSLSAQADQGVLRLF